MDTASLEITGVRDTIPSFDAVCMGSPVIIPFYKKSREQVYTKIWIFQLE